MLARCGPARCTPVAPAAIRHHRGADADEQHRRDQRPAEFEVSGRQRPFACGQRARPGEAEHQLRHQERGPVPAHGRRLVRARQQPAVEGPRDGAQDHVEVARHQPQPEQLPPFAAAEHQQHARHRQQRAADLAAADARAEEEGAHREHPQRQARADQRHVDGRGGLQRQVLEGVVQADAQQAEHRRQRRDQLPHHAADHGIAGPQQRRNEEQEDGEGSEALRLCLHGRRLYRAMIPAPSPEAQTWQDACPTFNPFLTFFPERGDRNDEEQSRPYRPPWRSRRTEDRRGGGRRARSGRDPHPPQGRGPELHRHLPAQRALPVPDAAAAGHGSLGVVEAVGEGVTHLKAGDRAAYASQPPGAYSETAGDAGEERLQAARRHLLRDRCRHDAQGLTTQYLLKKTLPAEGLQAGDFHRVPCRGRRRRPHRMPVGQGPGPAADRHSRQRRQVQARAGARRSARHQLQHRELRRPREGDHRGKGVKVVYDSVGKDTFEGSIDCLRPFGLLAIFGNGSGPVPPVTSACWPPRARSTSPGPRSSPTWPRAKARRRWPTTCSRWCAAAR
ncbi:zinc-binding dehydrogenase domain-containing protein [Ditylenchus destructor]|uniref:Zinc-binding dehydrogenase domain-containing protein n=1 Tax=Ditylenchus destructor TaxID=166010 RepID=A0AAD4MEX3_9BILA|nr:zinc-binding dehydrogenase domain-containing protein [Ditylenchus destructor]